MRHGLCLRGKSEGGKRWPSDGEKVDGHSTQLKAD